jgi:RNA 2',3'-cyclic 3'-phosphodiesterase
MRLFIAIELPDEVKQILADLRREMPGVKWVPQEQLHLTLLFLGEVEEYQLEPVCRALEHIVSIPFSLTFSQPGRFPRSGTPRVLWFGVERQPALELLAQRVKAAALFCGIVVDERPFSPHITLARVKVPMPPGLNDYLNHPAALSIPPLAVRDFVLFQSRLMPHGAVHLPVKVFPLHHH